ncbi:MAG TPA: 50S ribosomal protein L6 [Phycisphaerae bacterium]|nr:50S ribosomal protein L6 [Phycisphaerae bacterium]
MSRVGNKPIPVPGGVKVTLADHGVHVSGPKGQLTWSWPVEISVELDEGGTQVLVKRPGDEPRVRALHGLTRALIANMIQGASTGFERRLEVHGVGYNCKLQGRQLLLNLGYMGLAEGRPAQFVLDVPEGLEVEVTSATNPGRLMVRGADKQQVGQFAAEIRKLRPPEPYQGKGVRYEGEQIRRKQGKAFASGG